MIPRRRKLIQLLLFGISLALFRSFLLFFYASRIYNRAQVVPKKCHIGIISSFPPTKCGIAEYTKTFLFHSKKNAIFKNCSFEVLSVVRYWFEDYRYDDNVTVVFLDSVSPSRAYRELSDYIKQRGFSHLVLQHEFGLTNDSWQTVDLVRWVENVEVFSVIHSPRAYPTLDELSGIRHISKFSKKVIVMSQTATNSLIHAYGLNKDKIAMIPHGVDLNVSQEVSTLGLKETDLVILSNGLIHKFKGLHRMVRVMPRLLERIPNVYFVIVGQVHNAAQNKNAMTEILSLARKLGVQNHVKWFSDYLSNSELSSYIQRADIYVTLFDEITPTSATLLSALAHSKCVVSTPYRFAREVLGTDNGVIVPFENDHSLEYTIRSLLLNQEKRELYGRRGFDFVKQWSWDQIIHSYYELMMNDLHISLAQNIDEHFLVDSEAEWRYDSIVTFDFARMKSQTQDGSLVKHDKGKFEPGVYSIYVDGFIQINGDVDSNLELASVGIRALSQYFIMSMNGIDIEGPADSSVQYKVDKKESFLSIQTEQVHVTLEYSTEYGISIRFLQLNKYVNAGGLLGSTSRCRFDLFAHCLENYFRWADWKIPDFDLFSSLAPLQSYEHNNIVSNIFLPEDQFLQKGIFEHRNFVRKTLTVRIEGPIFDDSGIANVNRKMMMLLNNHNDMNIELKSQDNPTSKMILQSVSKHLAWSIQRKGLRNYSYFDRRKADAVFRNQWPPDFSRPESGAVWIHQQPWEFYGIPTTWKDPLNRLVDELWVPSYFCREEYEQNGIQSSKIQVIPHGVDFQSFDIPPDPYPLNTQKHNVFLFIGGLLPRKGVDVLLKAYTAEFTRQDDVVLVLHSIYGDDFALDVIEELRNDPQAPEIILIRKRLSDYQVTQLFQAATYYLAPFRSEGFGLTILEAMASGVPPIVTSDGPAIEFCSEAEGYLVDSVQVDCLVYPCGEMSVFGKTTVIQPRWAEPSLDSLREILRKTLTDTEYEKKTERCRLKAQQHSWEEIGEIVHDRILKLVDQKTNKM